MLARIQNTIRELGAFLETDGDGARAAAAMSIASAGRRATGLLAGVPIALKMSCPRRASRPPQARRILAGGIPPYDAYVVDKLRAAGA